jgi:two-component system nitrogen regulation sensor histidine kinase NtrY
MQITRLITNLVKNAIQAVEKVENPSVEVKVVEDAINVIITVADNGKGMSDEVKEKVFEPKFTTKSSGMGLGLPMVKNIIEAYDGTISFTTQDMYGTVFKVVLPKE